MRPLTLLCLLACALTGCSFQGDPASSHAGTYSGGMGTTSCPDYWFRGDSDNARYTCTPAGYRMAFTASGTDSSVTLIQTAAEIRVDAVVQSLQRGGGPAQPGIACMWERRDGWRLQLTGASRWALVAFGTARARAGGASPAIRPLTQRNHVILTCDGSGSGTRLSVTINDTVVARGVDVGGVVRFVSFGIWAAGNAGDVVLVSKLDATTR